MTNIITVKVGTFPGAVNEYSAEEGSKVATALELAGLSAENKDIRVNGASATLDTELNDGDRVMLMEQQKGASVTVKVGTFPGSIMEITVEDGATIAMALAQAGVDASNKDVRVGGAKADDFDQPVEEGQRIVAMEQQKGAK